MHHTLQELAALDDRFPTERKLLLVPDVNLGRELLASLAHARGHWVGWEAATLAPLAERLALVELAAARVRRASDVALVDTVNAAFDLAVGAGETCDSLARLVGSSGTRTAIVDAILELRAAGVTPAALTAAGADEVSASLAAVARRYEQLLEAHGLADPAMVFEAALRAFDDQARYALDHAVLVCTPGWTVRGTPRRLFERLASRGLRTLTPLPLAGERPHGLVETLAAPLDLVAPARRRAAATTIFCAGTPADELREALRRILASGRGLEDAELVTTNLDGYGVSLEALCKQTGVTATLLEGLPLGETPVGLALEYWLAGIDSEDDSAGMPAALAAGGWGPRADGDGRSANAPLAASFDPKDGVTTVADLAQRTAQALALVQPLDSVERVTLQRVLERLAEIGAVPRAPVPVAHALAALRAQLAGLRAWTSSSNTPRPRRATGGHLHLTSLENAGATGRPMLFVLGLDAERVAGPAVGSAILSEALRVRLNERGADLATTAQRRAERAWQVAMALGGSAPALTVSYALQGGADGQQASPAPALLQVAREVYGNTTLSYDGLRDALGAPATAVPRPTDFHVDARDVWMGALSDGRLLLNAERAARAHFAGLERGLRAVVARTGARAGPYHGVVPAAGMLDPRRSDHPISASSLERMASCTLKWFYEVALGARMPDAPVDDALVWLGPLDRGRALHTIYERIVDERLYQQPASAGRRDAVERIVRSAVLELERSLPVPDAMVRARELRALVDDAERFVTSEQAAYLRHPWETVATESTFGGNGAPAVLALDDGTSVGVWGRVDRVDRLSDGTLRLVDYKTGRVFELDTKRGPFDGGRHLQLAVYAPAVSQQLNGVVSVAEYRFPTARGNDGVARATAGAIANATRLVRSLLDDVSAGRFLPTIDKDDCTYCAYGLICRTRHDDYGCESPRAEWGRTHAEEEPLYAGVLERRLGADAAP